MVSPKCLGDSELKFNEKVMQFNQTLYKVKCKMFSCVKKTTIHATAAVSVATVCEAAVITDA